MFNFSSDSIKSFTKFLPHYITASVCLIISLIIANVSSALILRSIAPSHFDKRAKNGYHQQHQQMKPNDNTKLPSQYKVGKPFEIAIKDTSKPLVVEFYADWCPHCKRMTPIFYKLSKKYKDVNFATVDTQKEENSSLNQTYKINKYPSIIIIDTKTKNFEELVITKDSFNVEGLKNQIESSVKNNNKIQK